MTIKEKLRQYLFFKRVSRRKFTNEANLSDGFLKGNGAIGADKLMIIREICPDLNLNWLLFDEEEMCLTNDKTVNSSQPKKELPLIPMEAISSLGDGEIQITVEDIVDTYEIPDFKTKGVEYLVKLSGNSMYPKHNTGDLLGCKRITDTTFFQWGRTYVLDTDQGIMVKRVFSIKGNDDALECHSDNKENFPPFVINKSSIRNISIVVGCLSME